MAESRERCVRVARGQIDQLQSLLFGRVARDVTGTLAVANNPQTVRPVRVPKLRQENSVGRQCFTRSFYNSLVPPDIGARPLGHVGARALPASRKWMSPNGRLAMFGLGAAKRSKLNVLQLRLKDFTTSGYGQ